MPGRSWRDVAGQGRSAEPPPRSPAAVPVRPAAPPRAPAAAPDPRLAALMAEREALTRRMDALTQGGRQADPRDAARFPVATFAQRRAEERAFAERQEGLRARAPARTPPPPEPLAREPTRRARPPAARAAPPDPLAALFAAPTASARDFLAARDRDRDRLRASARDRLAPLTAVAEVGRGAQAKLQEAQGQLRDLDRQLAERDVSAEERAEIQRTLKSAEIDAVAERVGRATRAVEAPMRAVDRLDSAWGQRRDGISGAMDRTGPYAAARARRLGLDTGGSGDLFERAERARERALERRREARAAAARAEARRERRSAQDSQEAGR